MGEIWEATQAQKEQDTPFKPSSSYSRSQQEASEQSIDTTLSSQAGKVKSQTPKVAPQEDKPKKLQGRAKKRIQYNKRFVNVVLTNGKRKMCVRSWLGLTR